MTPKEKYSTAEKHESSISTAVFSVFPTDAQKPSSVQVKHWVGPYLLWKHFPQEAKSHFFI